MPLTLEADGVHVLVQAHDDQRALELSIYALECMSASERRPVRMASACTSIAAPCDEQPRLIIELAPQCLDDAVGAPAWAISPGRSASRHDAHRAAARTPRWNQRTPCCWPFSDRSSSPRGSKSFAVDLHRAPVAPIVFSSYSSVSCVNAWARRRSAARSAWQRSCASSAVLEAAVAIRLGCMSDPMRPALAARPRPSWRGSSSPMAQACGPAAGFGRSISRAHRPARSTPSPMLACDGFTTHHGEGRPSKGKRPVPHQRHRILRRSHEFDPVFPLIMYLNGNSGIDRRASISRSTSSVRQS